MAPNLRSTSRATSNNSRQSTPLNPLAATNSSSSTDCTRPLKQRRTGRNTRVSVNPIQETKEEGVATEGLEQHEQSDSRGDSNNTQPLPTPAEWTEPPVKPSEPSYRDTPWSAVSSETNPVLATMRPLGTMPTATVLRKARPAVTKQNSRQPSLKRKTKATDGEENEAEGPRPDSASSSLGLEHPEKQPEGPIRPSNGNREEVPDDANGSELAPLLVPESTEFDVGRIKTVLDAALQIADDSQNRAVSRGLRRLWEDGSKEPFYLSVLDSVVRQDPAPRQKSVFKAVMRHAFKSVQAETQSGGTPMERMCSAESTSSLSSAKSLDVDTLAPVVNSGAGNHVVRGKSRSAIAAALKSKAKSRMAEPVNPGSIPEPNDSALSKKRASEEEDPDSLEKESAAKRSGLRKPLPDLPPRESRVRTSLVVEVATASTSPAADSSKSRTVRRQSRLNGANDTVSRQEQSAAPTRTTRFTRSENMENNDFCHLCNGTGQLLCCDGCVDSYHFSCLNPPLDPADPPEGQWFCPSCSMKGPIGVLLNNIDKIPQREFQLPAYERNYFRGVRTGAGGKYEDVATNYKAGARGRGVRAVRVDEQHRLRLFDSKGQLILCMACGRTSNGVRPIIQCDHCPCSFHMDCVDPPLALPPNQKPGSDKAYHNWMCPNHTEHELFKVRLENDDAAQKYRIRRPRHPRIIDVDILPDDSEAEKLEEQELQGIVYRVPESGLKLNFIERIKRENLESEIRAAGATQYSQYAKKKLDDLISHASSYYASRVPAQSSDMVDAVTDIFNSRSTVDREAAMNLVDFAQENQDINNLQSAKINLLIDQLMATAPENTPRASSEIESLRALQELIKRRIETLTAQAKKP